MDGVGRLPPLIVARVRRLHAEANRVIEGYLLGQDLDPERDDVRVDLGAMTYTVVPPGQDGA